MKWEHGNSLNLKKRNFGKNRIHGGLIAMLGVPPQKTDLINECCRARCYSRNMKKKVKTQIIQLHNGTGYNEDCTYVIN